jgi:hypothetical protein
MIILFHGTGDDDTKDEHWMFWVAAVCRLHGEQVLVIPGVASKQIGEIEARCLEFLARLPRVARRNVTKTLTNLRVTAAISAAGEELEAATRVQHLGEEDTIRAMCSKKGRLGSNVASSQGIKLRAAVAGLCAIAYTRRMANPQPIRIIGHSRGGSAALASHNLLCAMDITCNHTLLLDPVHGRKKLFGMHKDYYHIVYAGCVTNLPTRNRNSTFADVPVTAAIGLDPAPYVRSLTAFTEMKHGHMGKFRAFEDKKAQAAQRLQIREVLTRMTRSKGSWSYEEHLEVLFDENLSPRTEERLILKREILLNLRCLIYV